MSLNPCTAKFAAAISNPWSEMAMGACVPIGTSNTLKVCSRGRIVMQVGLQGFGCAFMVPSFFKDVGGVYVTNSEYNDAVAVPTRINDGSGTIINFGFNRLPFGVGAESQNVNGRVVSCGMRIAYVGTLSGRNGTIASLTSPTHDDLSNQAGDANVGTDAIWGFEECRGGPVTNDSIDAIIYPISDRERNFRDNQANILYGTWLNGCFLNGNFNQDFAQYYYPLHGGDYVNAGNSYNIGPINNIVTVQGNPGDNYLVDYIIHVEYTGGSAAFGATPVAADADGVMRVTEAAAKAAIHSSATGQSYAKSFMSGLVETFREMNIGDSIRATSELFSLLSGTMSGSKTRSYALQN